MNCPTCGHDNPTGSHFCDACGVPLDRACARCGARLQPGDRFCDACGQAAEETSGTGPTTAPAPRLAETTQQLPVARQARRPRRWPRALLIAAVPLVLLGVAAIALGLRGEIAVDLTATTRSATAAPTATAARPARVFTVGNTGGIGVYVRRSTRLDDKDTAYVDGTRLEQIGDDATGDGTTWHHVRAPDGKTGWVPAQFTVESR